MKGKECCICGKMYFTFGNDARPIKYGMCCNECNKLVIVERMKEIQEEDKKISQSSIQGRKIKNGI